MSKTYGKSISITPFRSLVMDFLYLSGFVPAVTLERRMKLGPLVEARRLCTPRPMWSSIFTKAFCIVAKEQPILRRSYMSLPWPRFYEHAKNIAAVNVTRTVNGEEVVLQALIRSPENRSLAELDAILRRHIEVPVEEMKVYRNARRMSLLPWPLRRVMMWLTLNLIGRRRAHNFGTVGITSVAELGAGVLKNIPLLTCTFFYSLFDDAGNIDMRLVIDHRVMDGSVAARALARFEQVLLGEVLAEVKSMQSIGMPLAA
jgi:hypothetical protein